MHSWQLIGLLIASRDTREIVERVTVLPESELVVVPESGWGENLFEEAPAAPARPAEPAVHTAADMAGCSAVDGADALKDDVDVEDWGEEPEQDPPGPVGGAESGIAEEAAVEDTQADSDVTQVSDEEMDSPGVAVAEDEGISGGRGTAERAAGPSDDGVHAAKEQPGRPSTGSNPASGTQSASHCLSITLYAAYIEVRSWQVLAQDLLAMSGMPRTCHSSTK